LKDCRVVAACDVDQQHVEALVRKVNDHYKDTGCKGYHDYRELMARRDIDAVMLALPDHWHALAAVEAARQGKDIYGEKPLARTIREQQAIVRAVQANHRIWQTGSWQRSVGPFHKAAEIVRNGLIGKITRVEVGLPDGQGGQTAPGDMVPSTPPSELDYETWIGPSKMMPYIPEMKNILADALKIDRDLISIKAKTNEKMDAVGEMKAIEANAVIMLALK